MIIRVCLWTGFISGLLRRGPSADETMDGWLAGSCRDSQTDASKQMHDLSESVPFITPFHRQLYVRPFKTTWSPLKLALFTFLINVNLEHKSSPEQHSYICSNSQQYIVWVKMINFSLMPKIIRILRSSSMKIFCKSPTVNISKLNYWLLICIAKNFIWTTLKMIFSIFRFFAPSDSRFTNIVQTIHQWKDYYYYC